MLEAYDARLAEASGAAQQPAAAGPAETAAADVEADPFGLDALLEQQAAAEAAAAAKKRQVCAGGSRLVDSQVVSSPPTARCRTAPLPLLSCRLFLLTPSCLPSAAAHLLAHAPELPSWSCGEMVHLRTPLQPPCAHPSSFCTV